MTRHRLKVDECDIGWGDKAAEAPPKADYITPNRDHKRSKPSIILTLFPVDSLHSRDWEIGPHDRYLLQSANDLCAI